MREQLSKINHVRMKFIATFERFGSKTGWKGYPETTLLFKDIRNEKGNLIADHIWFTMNKTFEKLEGFSEGDKISFDARVREYVKGYVNNRDYIDNREVDYKLSHPTKIRKIENGTHPR